MDKETSLGVYREYYREVELHWSWRREKQIIVSPLEFEAVEAWYQAEIPLAVVLRAIDVFIEKKRKSKRQRGYFLMAVDGQVQQIHREYLNLRQGVGDHESGEEGNLLAEKLVALGKKLRLVAAKAKAEARSFLDALVLRLGGIDPSAVVVFEDIESQLTVLDAEMLAFFESAIPPEIKDVLREEASELVAEEEDPEFFKKLIADGVRDHFGLPRLTALG